MQAKHVNKWINKYRKLRNTVMSCNNVQAKTQATLMSNKYGNQRPRQKTFFLFILFIYFPHHSDIHEMF